MLESWVKYELIVSRFQSFLRAKPKLQNNGVMKPMKRLKKLMRFVLSINRDFFIFACYTGLAYSDVKALTKNQVQIGVDGNKWIYTRRSKTNTAVRIAILREAQEILDHYEYHPKIDGTDKLLPVYSNQKINY